jgi:hypothetical protein
MLLYGPINTLGFLEASVKTVGKKVSALRIKGSKQHGVSWLKKLWAAAAANDQPEHYPELFKCEA